MNSFPIIAVIDARAATAGRLQGARTDDPQQRPAPPHRAPVASVTGRPARQPSRKRSEKATRSTGGAETGSPSKVTA